MEDKIKAVIEELERLCPNEGAKYVADHFEMVMYKWPKGKQYTVTIPGFGSHTYLESDIAAYELDVLWNLLSLGVQSPALDESENARMRNALLDIEDDAHTKAVLGLPLNVRSILMSARHGLGIDSGLLHPESVADEKDENGLLPCPFCGKPPKFMQSPQMRLWYVSCSIPYCIGDVHPEKCAPVSDKVDAARLWNTCAHAPIAGKDHNHKAWEEANILLTQALDALNAEREKANNMVKALEEVVLWTDQQSLMDQCTAALEGFKGAKLEIGEQGVYYV